MRGLAVVAIGAILIWIGLSRGGADGVEAGDGGAEHAQETAYGASDPSRAGFSLTDGRERASERAPATPSRQDPPAPSDPPVGPAEADAEADAERAAGHAAGPEVGSSAPAAVPSDAGATRIVEAEEPADPPPIGDLTDRRPAAGDSAPIALTGASRPGRSRLAEQLLDSWLSQDAGGLETFLTVGDGVDLPAAQAQLAAGFWEAMVGTVEPARERLDAIRDDAAVTTEQVALLSAALDPPGTRALPRPASAPARIEPLAHSMRMILLENEARALTDARHYAAAARAWSDLVQMEIAAPWSTHQDAVWEWGREIALVQDNHRLSPEGDWPFVEEKVRDGDLGLTEIRARVLKRRKDLLVCVGLLREVNDVRKYIHPGDVIKVPTEHANVIVDIDSRVLLYRMGDEVVRLWQVGVGKPGNETPIGEYEIGDKLEKPAHSVWGLPYGHPENPLGSRWMALFRAGKKTSYGIHGTSDPDGVGGEVSLGCIRMRNEDVNELYELLPQDAKVVIQR